MEINPLNIHLPKEESPSQFKKLDESEQAAKNKVALARQISSLVNKEQALATKISKLSAKIQPLLTKEEAQRMQHLFASTTVRPEAVQLGQGIKKEATARAAHEQATLESLELNEERSRFRTFLANQKEQVERVQDYIEIGLEIAENIQTTKETLDILETIQNSEDLQTAWEEYSLTHPVHIKEEFTHWVTLAIQCFSLDTETEKLTALQKKETAKEEAIKQATREKKDITQLSNELHQLNELTKKQEARVKELQNVRSFGVLTALTTKGAKYSTAVKEMLAQGALACASLEQLSSSLLTGVGLISLIQSVNTLFTQVDTIKEINKNSELLDTFQKEFLETPNALDPVTNHLISSMLSMKRQHLARSLEISKSDTAFASLNALSGAVSLGQLGTALGAVLTSTVILTPGLNATAFVISSLMTTGTKAKTLHKMLKQDLPGTKLDVQIQEKSAQIYTAAGKFYAEAIRFDAIRKELEAITFKEKELKASIQTIRENTAKTIEKSKRQETSKTVPEIEEFYATIENNLLTEVFPVSTRRLEVQEEYNRLQNQLYQISKELDQIVSRKGELQDDRSLETLSQSFTYMQKSDLLVQYEVFQSALKDERVHTEFTTFLSQEAIPVTKGYVFESALRFIQNNSALPTSALSDASADPVIIHLPSEGSERSLQELVEEDPEPSP